MKADYDPTKDAIAGTLAALAECLPGMDPTLRAAAATTVDRDQSNASPF